MKKSIVAVLSLLAASACADPILIHVTGTANVTKWGYTQNQSYTFTWEVNDGYTNTDEDDSYKLDEFSPTSTRWYTEFRNEPQLWNNISGDLLDGNYTRPDDISDSPMESMQASSNGYLFDMMARADYYTTETIGLTLDNNTINVTQIAATKLDIGAMVHPLSPTDPEVWLSDYIGPYTQSVESGREIRIYSGSDFISFTPTSVTIAAIPEPAAVTTTIITALAALFIHRRSRATLPRG